MEEKELNLDTYEPVDEEDAWLVEKAKAQIEALFEDDES